MTKSASIADGYAERDIDKMVAGHPSQTASLGLNGVALLDFLRAFAANIVMVGHAGLIFNLKLSLNLGTAGVSIFFILSGFLITQSSLARIKRLRPYFAPYLIDRFARIFTAYAPALILVAIANAILPLGDWGQEGIRTGPIALLGNLFLLQDYPLFQAAFRLFGHGFYIRSYNTAEPFWTIPIEFWIYVVFGLGFFVLAARERLPPLLTVVLAAVALPVAIWNAAAGGGNGLSLVWLIGATGSFLWVQCWHRSAHRRQIGSIGLLVAIIIFFGRGLKDQWNFQDLGMSLAEMLIILNVLSIVEATPSTWRPARRLCTFLASYSYSLYLVHNTILIIVKQTLSLTLGRATLPVAFILCHVAAFFMYIAFEQHYRHVGAWLKRRLRLQQGQIVV